MDRRDFLRSTGGLAALATGYASASRPAAAQTGSQGFGDRRTFTFASPWKAHHAGFADDAHRLARRIEAATGNAFAFELHTGSPARADFTVTSVQPEIALHPAFAYFGGLPGDDAFSPLQLDAWLSTGGGQDLWDELAAHYGFKPVLAGHTGSHPVLWSRRPILKSEDLAGQIVVARGLDAEIMRALGAIPIAVDETSLEFAVSAPETAAVVWGSLVQASAAGIPARFPYGLSGALGSGGGAIALEVDLTIWHNLTATERAMITAIAQSEFRASVTDAAATRAAVSHAVASQFGVEIKAPEPEFSAAVSRIGATLIAHTAAYDSAASRIDARYSSFGHTLGPAV